MRLSKGYYLGRTTPVFYGSEQSISEINTLFADIDVKNAVHTGDGTAVTRFVDSSGNGNDFVPTSGTWIYRENSGNPYVDVTSGVAACDNTMANYWGKSVYTVFTPTVANRFAIHGVAEASPFQYDGLWVEHDTQTLYNYHGNGSQYAGTTIDIGTALQNNKHIFQTESSGGHLGILVDGLYKRVQGKAYTGWDVQSTPTIGASYRTMTGRFERHVVFTSTLSRGDKDIVVNQINQEHTGLPAVNLWRDILNRCRLIRKKGQSNGDGRETVSLVQSNNTDNFLSLTGVNFSDYEDQTGSYIFNSTTQAFDLITLDVTAGTTNCSNLANRVGIGLFLGKDLYDSDGVPSYLINSCVGGSLLYDDGVANSISCWYPKNTTEAPVRHLDGAANLRYFEALLWMQNNNLNPYEVIDIRWQGEQDAHDSLAAANTYQSNDSDWLSYYASEIGLSSHTVHTVRLHDNNDATDQPYLSTVIAAQIANSSANNIVYDPSFASLIDITHVSGAGMKLISDLIRANI